MRIVSLLPSATEIVGALGALEDLVGITHACDWPPEARSRVRVTQTGIDSTRAPGEVDAQVRALAKDGVPLYSLHGPAIRDLSPDVILTQALCEVCAVHEGDVRALAASMSPSPTVVTLAASTLDAVFDDIRSVGAAIGRDAGSESLRGSLHTRIRGVHETLRAAHAPRPRVVVVEWTDPVFTGGHWIPEMIHRAGGEDVIGAPGAHSRTIPATELRDAAPDIVIVAPCGCGLARAAVEARQLLLDPDWSWAGTRDVWAVDANALASRPGPRLVDGIEVFASIFHPTLFPTPDAASAVRIT